VSSTALIERTRTPPHTAIAKVLDIAFGTQIDWTVRVLVTADLVRRHRWRALAGRAGTIVLGEVSVGPLKAAVDRIRPSVPLTRTSMMSYPSGHALAATTTAPGLAIALLPPGPEPAHGSRADHRRAQADRRLDLCRSRRWPPRHAAFLRRRPGVARR